MAISYVGGVEGGRAGSTSTTTQSLSGTLTGGSNTSPSAGDLVVVWCASGGDGTGSPTNQDISGNNSGAYNALTFQSRTTVTYDTFSEVSYKIQGGTVDTSLTIPSSGNARNAQRWIVHVFRGVDGSTPIDVTPQYATGTATGRPDPAAITPATAGAWICAFYASAAAVGTAYTAPTDFATDWLGNTTADTADVMTGGGYYTGWASGSYNPAAISAGGTTGANDSWTATTIALRPAPQTLTQAEAAFYEDGTETGSTVIDSGADSITRDVTSSSNLQLRVRLQATNSIAGDSTDDYQLQYELNDSANWLNVDTATVDTYATSNVSDSTALYSGAYTGAAQSFRGNGGVLKSVDVFLRKYGSPTGNAVAKIYAHSGSFGTSSVPTGAALATSDNFDVSTLTTSNELKTIAFTGANKINIGGGDYVLSIEYSGGNGTNFLQVCNDAISSTHQGNLSEYNGSWVASSAKDMIFTVTVDSGTGVIGYNSASLTDGNATTNRLGSGTGSFVAGEISEDGLVDNLQITASNYTELLYSLTLVSSALSNNDTIDFRVLRNGATTGVTYTVTPRITVSKTTGDDHTIVVQDISHTLNEDNTTLTQNHVVPTQDTSQGLTLDNTTITQNHILTAQDISHSLTLDNTTVPLNYTLTVQDVSHSFTIDTTSITQNHIFTPDDLAFSLTEDNGSISQNHILVAQDISLSFTVDTSTLTQNHIIPAQDISHSQTIDAASIAQNHILPTQDISHGSNIDNTALTQNHVLAIQDISHSLTEDSTTIAVDSVNYDLVVQDISHSFTLDATTITQNHIFTPDDIAFSPSVDSTSVNQNHVLVTQDIQLGLTEDNGSITQNHIVASQDVQLGLTEYGTTIDLAVLLPTQDISLGFSLDTTSITQNHVLTPDDIAMAPTEDGAVITQNHIIATQDVSLGFTVDTTSTAQNHVLQAQDISHSLSLDISTLAQLHIIQVGDTTLGFTEDHGSISQIHTLSTQDLELAQSLDNVAIQEQDVELTPSGVTFGTAPRKYYIDSDGNIYWVLNQSIGLVERV
jgi:hypothetical protein